MISDLDLIASYEDMLMNATSTFKQDFCATQKDHESRGLTVLCCYLLEDVLDLNPIEAKTSLTKKTLKEFKLWNYIEKFIDFEPGMNEQEQIIYLLHLCYPKIIPFDKKRYVISIYEKVINRQMAAFPKKFFSEKKGATRACICLQYMVDKLYSFHTVNELYELFNNEAEMAKILKENKMHKACYLQYDTPLDFLHYSLSPAKRNTFLYNYFKFNSILEQTEKKESKN